MTVYIIYILSKILLIPLLFNIVVTFIVIVFTTFILFILLKIGYKKLNIKNLIKEFMNKEVVKESWNVFWNESNTKDNISKFIEYGYHKKKKEIIIEYILNNKNIIFIIGEWESFVIMKIKTLIACSLILIVPDAFARLGGGGREENTANNNRTNYLKAMKENNENTARVFLSRVTSQAYLYNLSVNNSDYFECNIYIGKQTWN